MKTNRRKIRVGRPRAGYVIIAVAFGLMMAIGMLGLCLDLSRMYVLRNELQVFVDAAALAATLQLDGTDQGIRNARNTALGYPNRINFQTANTDTFSTNFVEYKSSRQLGTANGRRLVVVPVNHMNIVVGFALFLLHDDICGEDNVAPCCAEYVANDPLMPGRWGNGNAGAYQVKLYK